MSHDDDVDDDDDDDDENERIESEQQRLRHFEHLMGDYELVDHVVWEKLNENGMENDDDH